VGVNGRDFHEINVVAEDDQGAFIGYSFQLSVIDAEN
jgi:hypothetical protein